MMEIEISAATKLKTVQEAFSNYYPFLRLEFYSKPHGFGVGSDKKERLDSSLTIGQVCQLPVSGYLPLHGSQKVGDFEQLFAERFGLNVQVFRKSYGQWLQSWASDIWTIDFQNDKGRKANE